jgi:hypothetical protein
MSFCKKKKEFPPETFIPTPKRLLAIIQLCIVFSLILWYATQPFMGEYFALRSRMLLYEYVMGTSELVKSQLSQEKLTRHVQRFNLLSEPERQLLIQDYQFLQNRALRSTWNKIQDGLHTLLFAIPPFEMAWLFFSTLLAILLLLKVEGASQAVWILPLIVLAYSIDNRLNGRTIPDPPDLALFPTEATLIQHYLKEPLSSNWLEQKQQLQVGWERYLVSHWLLNKNERSLSDWQQQVEQANFNFTLARLKRLHSQPSKDWLSSFNLKLSYSFLCAYFLWNLFFAWSSIGQATGRDCHIYSPSS